MSKDYVFTNMNDENFDVPLWIWFLLCLIYMYVDKTVGIVCMVIGLLSYEGLVYLIMKDRAE
jgi:lipid-A-disaccharide synthase-like uncharacterized protein